MIIESWVHKCQVKVAVWNGLTCITFVALTAAAALLISAAADGRHPKFNVVTAEVTFCPLATISAIVRYTKPSVLQRCTADIY